MKCSCLVTKCHITKWVHFCSDPGCLKAWAVLWDAWIIQGLSVNSKMAWSRLNKRPCLKNNKVERKRKMLILTSGHTHTHTPHSDTSKASPSTHSTHAFLLLSSPCYKWKNTIFFLILNTMVWCLLCWSPVTWLAVIIPESTGILQWWTRVLPITAVTVGVSAVLPQTFLNPLLEGKVDCRSSFFDFLSSFLFFGPSAPYFFQRTYPGIGDSLSLCF